MVKFCRFGQVEFVREGIAKGRDLKTMKSSKRQVLTNYKLGVAFFLTFKIFSELIQTCS